MRRKLSNFLLATYLAISRAANTLKKDERGLSGVVVAILLILIAVLAIILIWGFLGNWLGDLWEIITGQAATIEAVG